MADSKVSELTAATSAAAADQLYIVQSSTSKRITIANLFKSLSNVTLSGNLALSGVQSIAAAGIINNTSLITHLTGDGTGGECTIPVGTVANQMKYVMYIAGTGTYNLVGNIAGNANVQYNNVGDATTLMYTNSKWFVVGGTANVIYP